MQAEQLHPPLIKEVLPLPLEQIKETEEEENQSALNPHAAGAINTSMQSPPTHNGPHNLSHMTHIESSHFGSVNKTGLNQSSVIVVPNSLPGSHSSFVGGVPYRAPSTGGGVANVPLGNLNASHLSGSDQAKTYEEGNPFQHKKSLQSQILQNAVNYALQKNSQNCS